jgi:hypothetical protein
MQKINLSLLLMLLILASCGSASLKNKKSLTAEAVSMTLDLRPEMHFMRMDKVHGEQCITHSQKIKGNDGNYLYDELIFQTQQKYAADAILDVVFYDTKGCVALDGTPAKLVQNSPAKK